MLQGKFISKPLWRCPRFDFSNVYVVHVQPYSRNYLHHGHISQVYHIPTPSLYINLEFNLLCTNEVKIKYLYPIIYHYLCSYLYKYLWGQIPFLVLLV